jgi:pSer/pThr/pTyr-binding forkhead associated (FHA) protein
MSATVTLKVVEGPLCGAEFTYSRAALCSVGRSQDCSLQLPNEDWNRTVSRRHCLLEIDPPLVRVCDLGSLNGTFVNGEPIGRRDLRSRLDDVTAPICPDHVLADGDELRVGDNVFRVQVCVDERESESDEQSPCVAAHHQEA